MKVIICSTAAILSIACSTVFASVQNKITVTHGQEYKLQSVLHNSGISYRYYFDELNLRQTPWKEVDFLDRISSVGGSYIESDHSFRSLRVEDTGYGLDGVFYSSNERWRLAISAEQEQFDQISQSQVSVTTDNIRVILTPGIFVDDILISMILGHEQVENWIASPLFTNRDYDVWSYGVSAKALYELESFWLALESKFVVSDSESLSEARLNESDNYDSQQYAASAELYFNPRVSVGLNYNRVDSKSVIVDREWYGLSTTTYITPTVGFNLEYSKLSKGPSGINSEDMLVMDARLRF